MNRLLIQAILTGLLFVGGTSTVAAHNPLSARYHFEAGSLASELTISLSQDGVNQALLQTHDRKELEALPRNAFEELIVAYLKSNFNLSVNGLPVTLGQGGVKLGDHQTDLRFVLPAFTAAVDNIDVHIPAFRENDHHQTIFSYAVDGKAGHVILREDNDFHATVAFQSSVLSTDYSLLVVLGGVVLLLGFLLYWSNFRGAAAGAMGG